MSCVVIYLTSLSFSVNRTIQPERHKRITTFVEFQRRLVIRGTSSNPLNFRATAVGEEMDKLLNIFAFVRKYTLSSRAGTVYIIDF